MPQKQWFYFFLGCFIIHKNYSQDSKLEQEGLGYLNPMSSPKVVFGLCSCLFCFAIKEIFFQNVF